MCVCVCVCVFANVCRSLSKLFDFCFYIQVFKFCIQLLFLYLFLWPMVIFVQVVALRAPAIALLEAAKLCHKRLFFSLSRQAKKSRLWHNFRVD